MKRQREKTYSPEFPPGYREACEKYPEFEEDSVGEIWDQLYIWREFEKGFPREKAKGPLFLWQLRMEEAPKEIAEFKERILKAAHDRDLVYLGKFLKAMELPSPPKPKTNAYRAAIEAFEELYIDGLRTTREEWPTKQMVRQRAEEILKESGLPSVSNRHWPRVFKQAGLSALPAGGYNRP